GHQAATWQVGGGQIDDLAASNVGAAASPSSLSFGKRNAATQDRFHAAIDVSLSSLSGQYERYQVSVVPDPGTSNPGIATPSFVGAPDRKPGSFTVSLNTHATQAEPRTRYSGLIVLNPVRRGPDSKHSSTQRGTMRAYLSGGGRLDVLGQIFADQVVLAVAAPPPTGTVVRDDYATADAFLVGRFGIDVLNDGVALDPAGGGLPIR